MDLLQTGHVHVRVPLRRGDTGVSKHFLHLPQVGSAGQQMGRKTMPQGVGAHGVGKPKSSDIFFHQFPNPFPSERSSAGGNE